MLQSGDVIGGCRVERLLGRGGMASVFLAYQPNLDRYVAIKVLPAFLAEEEGFRERFQQEAQAVARLRHPHILVVFDYGEERGISFLICEYIEGGSLAERMGAPMPLQEVVRLLGPIAGALDYAHGRGIVHRDVKPSNVLIAADGSPVLCDFGMARVLDARRRLTQTGMVLGTPEYMAPETAADSGIGPSVDRYALAVMAYELLTGSVPFEAQSPQAVLLAHLQKPVPSPRSRNGALSPEVEVVLLRGLAKKPAERHASSAAFVAALEAAAAVGAPDASQRASFPRSQDKTLRMPAAERSTNAGVTRALPQPALAVTEHMRGTRRFSFHSWRVPIAVLVVALLGVAASVLVALQLAPRGSPVPRPLWSAIADLPAAVALSQAVTAPDGEALVLGGYGNDGTTAAVQAYEMKAASWRQLPHMQVARSQFAAVMLADGRVLVIGGDTGSTITADTEVLDFGRHRWSTLEALRSPRRSESALLLRSGMVLVAGGEDARYQPLTTTDLFNPRTQHWQSAGATATPHYGAAAVLLADGRVLLAGGGTAACEIYDPGTGTWSAAASLHHARLNHSLTLLRDGRVLAAGGADAGDQSDQASAELYDPRANSWTLTGGMRVPRSRQTAVLLRDGTVLVAGGRSGKAILSESEIYHPATGRWSAAPSMHSRRADASTVTLAGGDVLLAGGTSGPEGATSSAEIFSLR